jgi:CheY-like chemotaxis protein
LLTANNGYTDLILDSLPPIDPIRGDLEEIRKAAQRATSLTSQLLSFARKQMIEPRVLRLNDLILDMNRLLRRLIGENIELVTSLDPALSRVKVDSGQFEQVLVNLAINARDAMPNGGQLWIGTANTTIDQTYARTQMDLHPGAYVQLSVRDTGVGMDARVQAHLFEPFFTTKGPDKGTGLGLATCYGIVRQHNGHISIQSEFGQGTTVTILLPPVADISIEATRRPDQALPARSAEVILLAEDEDSVRSLVARVLRGQGYTVLEADNGVEALRVAREYAGPIDLLLTDVVMPQLGGKALAVQLAAVRPGIKTLFMSGYTDRGTSEQGSLGPDAAFLMKPFTSAALARKVRSVLDA